MDLASNENKNYSNQKHFQKYGISKKQAEKMSWYFINQGEEEDKKGN